MAFIQLLVTGDALSELEGSTTIDLNAVTNLILPTADPTADGEVAIDIVPPTDFADDVLTWWGGTNIMTAVALAADQMPSGTNEDGFHVKYDATANEFQLVAAAGGGTVTSSGSPLVNQVAVFTTATDIDSTAGFEWDGSLLIAPAITATGIITGGSLVLTTDLIVDHGGTGVSTITDGGVMIGADAAAVEFTDAGTAGSATLSDEFLRAGGSGVNPDYKGIEQTVTLIIESPVADDNITIRHFNAAATIQEVHSICTAGTSVTFNLYMDADRSTETTKAFTSDQVISAGTTMTRDTPNTAAIAENDILFIDLSAVSGTPTEFAVTVRYTTT